MTMHLCDFEDGIGAEKVFHHDTFSTARDLFKLFYGNNKLCIADQTLGYAHQAGADRETPSLFVEFTLSDMPVISRDPVERWRTVESRRILHNIMVLLHDPLTGQTWENFNLGGFGDSQEETNEYIQGLFDTTCDALAERNLQPAGDSDRRFLDGFKLASAPESYSRQPAPKFVLDLATADTGSTADTTTKPSRPPRKAVVTKTTPTETWAIGGTISPKALAILEAATTTKTKKGESLVYLNCGHLSDRDLYEEVAEVLKRIGGKWKGGKVQAHVFKDDVTEILNGVVKSGLMPSDNPLDYYPTPPELASEIICNQDLLELPADLHDPLEGESRLVVLEPSAGRGGLIDALLEAMRCEKTESVPALRVVAVECDTRNLSAMRAKYEGGSVEIHEGNFLEWTPPTDEPINRVLMNPPFTEGGNSHAYIDHIMRAYEFLAPGGILVAITPPNWRTAKQTKCQAFAAFVRECGRSIDNEKGAFKSSGTNVQTVTIQVTKPSWHGLVEGTEIVHPHGNTGAACLVAR